MEIFVPAWLAVICKVVLITACMGALIAILVLAWLGYLVARNF